MPTLLAGIAGVAGMSMVWVVAVPASRALAQGEVVIVVRGGEDLPGGEPTGVTSAGVVFATREGGSTTLGWDRVAEVRGPLASAAGPFLERGRDAWRARTRLERGDYAGAEPIFERLMESAVGERGSMEGMIAGGAMRCRLARGSVVGATSAFIAFVAATEGVPAAQWSGPWMIDHARATPAIDERWGLAPDLPPIWLATPTLAALPDGWLVASAGTAPASRARTLAQLYELAASIEAGRAGTAAGSSGTAEDPGLTLVRRIVATRATDREARDRARAALRETISGNPDSWVEAWCRLAIGRSLLREEDESSRLLGLVEVLHVPARLESQSPTVAGIALAEAALACLRLGEVEQARSLREELFARFPGHPGTAVPELTGWTTQAAPTRAAPSTDAAGPASPPTNPTSPTPANPPAGGLP